MCVSVSVCLFVCSKDLAAAVEAVEALLLIGIACRLLPPLSTTSSCKREKGLRYILSINTKLWGEPRRDEDVAKEEEEEES